jgi:hypothetical protein
MNTSLYKQKKALRMMMVSVPEMEVHHVGATNLPVALTI